MILTDRQLLSEHYSLFLEVFKLWKTFPSNRNLDVNSYFLKKINQLLFIDKVIDDID